VVCGVCAVLLLAIITLGMATALSAQIAVPSWIELAAGVALILLAQTAAFAVLVLTTLQGRRVGGFLPLRDYRYFIAGTSCLKSADPAQSRERVGHVNGS